MKNQFEKRVAKWRYSRFIGYYYSDWGLGRYEHRFASVHRGIKTFNEIRKNSAAIDDGYYVRGRRRKATLPTVNDDQNISRNWKRSWKDFTKYRKQYMVNLG